MLATIGQPRDAYPRVAADARAELIRATLVADSLALSSASAPALPGVSSEAAIALGYLERLRLGLGSPFRLVDQARQDPRLPSAMQRTVAWALLAHTLAGNAYQIDPAVLDTADAPGASSGGWQLPLIEDAVRDAEDPEAGELAVRLGYALARAERSVTPVAVTMSAQVAALVRDRELARRDAVTLLDEARVAKVDPLLLVAAWRADRRFAVERPPLAEARSAAREARALGRAARIAEVLRDTADAGRAARRQVELAARDSALDALDTLRRASRSVEVALVADTAVVAVEEGEDAADDGAGSELVTPAVPAAPWSAGWLRGGAAAQLADLSALRAAGPPQAAVVTAVRQHRGRILAASDAESPGRRAMIARFATQAVNEETLVAARALLAEHGPVGRAPASAVLGSAVSLRAYAQEPVWFPGSPAPTVAELRQRYELGAVTFDRDVPLEWRPFYVRMLAMSLDDMRRVFPALSLRSAAVHFGESVLRDSALALHDPVQRRIYLPVATSAGAIAHEIAHDLDWQAARTRRRVRGDYLTDRAVREGRGRLAAAIAGLTTEPLTVPAATNSFRSHPMQRPTEVFARSVDWFVAAALAREGRANGYLTTVQDEVLTGYTLVAPPDASGRTGQALADALDDVTDVPAPLRAWFVGRYGLGRDLGSYERLREVLTLPRSPRMSAGETTAWEELGSLPGPTLAGLELLAAQHTAPVTLTRAACAASARERWLRRSTLARTVALGTEARLRGAQRDNPGWVGAVGPVEPEILEQRAAHRRARFLTRLRMVDASRDPLGQWLADRATGECGTR